MANIILKRDVDGLGIIGDVMKVNDGFARNFLIPKKMAEVATPVAVKRLEKERAQRQFELEEELGKAQKLSDRLRKITLKIRAKVSEEGTLYGSVGATEIIEAAMKQKLGLEKEQILLDGPIKELGETNVAIRIHSQVTSNLVVVVIAE